MANHQSPCWIRPVLQFVTYLRVSSDRQGRSGLGLEAQREAVARHAAATGGDVVAEFVEVESGRRSINRPQLAAALAACRARRCVLLIARLDRLARNVHFVSGLLEAGVEFVAADLPSITRFTIHILAAVAEEEARLASTRTKAALAVAKARGVWLGNPRLQPGTAAFARIAADAKRAQAKARAADLAPVIAEIRAAGIASFGGLSRALAARGVPTLSGRGRWDPSTVRRMLLAEG
jgi:DNA invertase Pin-like site-specific DNA recombinase